MQDGMLKVYKTLNASKKIKELFKGIYNNPIAPDDTVFPRLTMFEVSNQDTDFADDEAKTSKIYIRLDIWSLKNNLFELSAAVKEVLKSEFRLCNVELGSDIYEQDSKIYHKVIDLIIKIEQ